MASASGLRIQDGPERVDDVISGERLAVMKCHPLAELHDPFGRVRVRGDRGRQDEDWLGRRGKADQRLEKVIHAGEVGVADRIQRIKGVRA
jgi:hypothetical protein